MCRDANPAVRLAHAAFEDVPHAQPRTDFADVDRLALVVKEELRAMTKNHGCRDRPVMMSSVRPSAKYSCSGSPLMFWNGKTAIEGLFGSGKSRDP